MATHEERIQALEDLVPGIARSQEMIVDALGAISEAMWGIVRTQQEHSVILQTHSTVLQSVVQTLDEHTAILMEHSAILQEHSAILQEHSVILQEHTVLLRSIVSSVQEQSLELARIRGNMALD